MSTKKNNYEFLLLQTVGIILVVLGHKGGISLFSEWFPAYSFHMPLFIFISGYFYKSNSESNLKYCIMKKIKNLIIPYFIWNIVYGIIINILIRYQVVEFGERISFRTLFIDPWIHGHQFGLNVATWFVPALFLIQVAYLLSRRVLNHIKINNEYVIMGIFMVIGCVGVILANKGYTTHKYLTVIRTMFLIPFYHMGYLYRNKLENKYKFNSILYFIALFTIQFILLKKYVNISFSAVFCNDFNRENILLPYITSITGIMFWLKISKILAPLIGKNKVIKYIGSNTWDIMTHHQFVFFGINLFFAITSNKLNLEGFNFEQFKHNCWYGYDAGDSRFLIFYTIAGVAVPLIIKFYVENIMKSEKGLIFKQALISKFTSRSFTQYDPD
ncbi:acyltransferase family protein [Paraclostridium sordellii]